jgi:branched-chain amino acid transport system substrate-binding protein
MEGGQIMLNSIHVRCGKVLLVILVITFALTPWGVSGQTPKKWSIHVLSPTTGRFAAYSIDYNLGMDISVKEINEAGGISGKPIDLIRHDTQSDIPQAVSLARQACQRGALIIIGPELSTEAESVFPVVNREGCPIFAPTPAKPDMAAPNRPWTFVTCSSATRLTPSGVSQFYQLINPKTVVMVVDKSDPSASLQADLSTATLQSYNVKVQTIGVTKDDVDFSSVVVRVAAVKPDAIIISTLDRPAAGMLEELTRQRLTKIPIMITQAGYTPALVRLGADVVEGVFIYSEFWVTNPDPRVQKFVEKFKKARGGEMPTHLGAQAYDSVYLVKYIFEKTGITGDPAKLQSERVAVRDTLQGLKNYWSLTGSITISEKGEADKDAFLLVYRKGVLERVVVKK